MKNLTSIALIVLTAAVLSGCGTTIQYTATNTSPRPLTERDPASVHVFTTGGPARPYAEVGLIQGQEDMPGSSDMPELLAEMRAEAARRGCDGLVITSRADEASGFVTGNKYGTQGYSGTREGLMGACIVYADAPAGTEPVAVAIDTP